MFIYNLNQLGRIVKKIDKLIIIFLEKSIDIHVDFDFDFLLMDSWKVINNNKCNGRKLKVRARQISMLIKKISSMDNN